MRRIVQLTAAAAWLGSALGLAIAGDPGAAVKSPPAPTSPVKAGACGNCGTTVEFVRSPSEAARLAKEEKKLVLVLHVSGHFEDPAFT